MTKKSALDKIKETSAKNQVDAVKHIEKPTIVQEANDVEDNEPKFQTSLNEDLQELLDKNPRRFFGGCGG